MAEQRDVIEVLEHDHREVEEMFSELESLRGASADEERSRRKELTEQVTIELVRHSVAEEVLVYPRVEDKVSAEEAEHAREEHAEAEETLQRLEKLDADDPAFDDELATLMGRSAITSRTKRARCSRTCERSSTTTSCASWGPP
jgi:iron-sulfur cluster repair protein YtfE (RIC family)